MELQDIKKETHDLHTCILNILAITLFKQSCSFHVAYGLASLLRIGYHQSQKIAENEPFRSF